MFGIHHDQLKRLTPRSFEELLTEDLDGAFLFIQGVLGFHELTLQDLHTLMQQGVAAAFFEIGPLGTDEGGMGAADVLWAGLEEIQFAEAGFAAVSAIDEDDVFIDLAGGEELLDGGDIRRAVEILIWHLDQPVHLELADHRCTPPALATIIGELVHRGDLGLRGKLQQSVFVEWAVLFVGGGFDEVPGAVGHAGILCETSAGLEEQSCDHRVRLGEFQFSLLASRR